MPLNASVRLRRPYRRAGEAPLPIPGGTLEAWDDFLAREAAERNGARMSNAQALARFGGEAA